MALDRFLKNGRIQRFPKTQADWTHFINETAKWIASQELFSTAQTDITTAQTSADNAGAHWVNSPSGQVWNTDTAGAHEVGNPTQDILFTLYDNSGAAIATTTLKGTMTSATGAITITTTGTDTGLTTTQTFDPATNADVSVKANVTATFADGSQIVTSAGWSSVDETAAGGTPASGGGK